MATIPGTLNTNLTDEQVLEAFDNALTHTPSDSTPKEDGSGSAGEAETFARSDHEHPHDTTKQDTLAFEGTYNASTNKATTMSAVKDGKLTGYAQASGNVAATDKIIEAIGKVEKKADDNKTNISLLEWDYQSNSNSTSIPDTWSYTGLSFEVPANTAYQLIASDRSPACTGIAIADNNTDITSATSIIGITTVNISDLPVAPWQSCVNTISPKYSSNLTFYVWVRRNAVVSNVVSQLAAQRII